MNLFLNSSSSASTVRLFLNSNDIRGNIPVELFMLKKLGTFEWIKDGSFIQTSARLAGNAAYK